jgi:predicted transcriptional regulator of viral defense system
MEGLTTKKYKGLGDKESFLLLSLARKDKQIFTIDDAKDIITEQKL